MKIKLLSLATIAGLVGLSVLIFLLLAGTVVKFWPKKPLPPTSHPIDTIKPVSLKTGVIHVPILLYHRIRDNKPYDRYSVTIENFDKQMAYLKNNGYNVIPFSLFYSALTTDQKLPENPMVISFDDNYVDQYTNAYPILKKYNFPAIFYIQTKMTNHKTFLSWEMMREMLKNNMEIGSHTVGHRKLTKISAKDLEYELLASQEILEQNLYTSIYDFAYPYGLYSKDVAKAVEAAGYRSAATVVQSADHNRASGTYTIKRLPVTNDFNLFLSRIKK